MTILIIIAAVGAAVTAFVVQVYYKKKPPVDPEMLYVPLPEAPQNPPEPPKPINPPIPMPPKKDMLATFCTAIRDYEGQPGDLNYKNNNPGNFRCSPVGYLPKYGNVRCVNHFAVFPSYELGWEYLEASVMHWASLHPTWTIFDFFSHYAPPSDNNPTLTYAANVAGKCGVPVSTRLKDLFA